MTILRKPAPYARSIPVRTIRTAYSSSMVAPNKCMMKSKMAMTFHFSDDCWQEWKVLEIRHWAGRITACYDGQGSE